MNFGCVPKPSYLEYVGLMRTWEAHQELLKKASPEALRRFNERIAQIVGSEGKDAGK